MLICSVGEVETKRKLLIRASLGLIENLAVETRGAFGTATQIWAESSQCGN